MINLIAFFRVTRLTFVKKKKEQGDIYSFFFTPSRPLKHIAGQHALFVTPKFNVRIFSLASAPEEQHVMIGTHTGTGTRFKNHLLSLKPGDKMTIMGPVLNFTLPPNAKSVALLAQGIGITPFRSMLTHAQKKELPVHTTLIHVEADDHTYQSTTQKAANIARYPKSAEEFNQILADTVNTSGDATLYYTSGSPRFNRATIKTLVSLGIPRSRIKKDGFLGY